MSTRIQYSCPNCKNIISGYSKRGFSELHTGVGLPFLICDNCYYEISSRLQPWSMMNREKKWREVAKTSLNILIISAIFGGLFLGGGFYFLTKKIDLNIPFFDLTSEGGRFKEILFYLLSGMFLLSYYKFRRYKNYYLWVEKQRSVNRFKIPAGEFIEKYPDW